METAPDAYMDANALMRKKPPQVALVERVVFLDSSGAPPGLHGPTRCPPLMAASIVTKRGELQ